jgi:hypothetical protein
VGKNNNLIKAKKEKNDEFYTRYEDIEKELKHYTEHLKDKVIYCNCDDPSFSNFYKYFSDNFKSLSLKKLITTHYVKDGQSYKLELDEQGITKTPLNGNGDFRSEECIEILKTADIVITNPPFSLFREFIATLFKYDKQILLIGNHGAITYKEVFKHIKNKKLWIGVSKRSMNFKLPNGDLKEVNACWFTNLNHSNIKKSIKITVRYNKDTYQKYDNCDAIEVSRVKNIPTDYYEPIGVPITFLDSYDPKQFEILGLDDFYENKWRGKGPSLNGKVLYHRIIIKRIET